MRASIVVLLFLTQASRSWAQTPNDVLVQPTRLAAPSRGSVVGSLSGLGFGPSALARGAFQLPSPIAIPSARGGHLADVMPTYSPEAGLSEWGMGWSVSLSIHRQPLRGDVRYDTADFVSPWGRLLQGTDGRWYPEGHRQRVRLERTPTGWIATAPDGRTYDLGQRIDNARGTYAWYLTRVRTLDGDQMVIDYEANASGQVFVREIRYGGRGHVDDYRVTPVYETVATPAVRYTSGSPLVLDRRVRSVAIDVRAPGGGPYARRWTYALGYQVSALSPTFYLSSVVKTFASGESDPPISYLYDLNEATLDSARFRSIPQLQTYLTASGGTAIQPTRSTMVDVDEDGRPDFEDAAAQTLVRHTDAGWVPEVLAPAPAADTWCRPAPHVANLPRPLARMTGDEGAPHVVRTELRGNRSETSMAVCTREGVPLFRGVVAGAWAAAPNTRMVDLDRDRRPDFIRVFAGGYEVLENTSTAAGISFSRRPLAALAPSITPGTTWIHDVNGDALPDLVVRTPSQVWYWPGRGNFEFAGPGINLPVLASNGAPLAALDTYGFSFVDANRDGLTDLVMTRSGSAFLLIGSGQGFRGRPVAGLVVAGSMLNPVIGDLRGAGLTEINYVVNQQAFGLALDAASTGLMTSADDGLGTVARFSYAHAPAAAGIGRRPVVLAALTLDQVGDGSDVSTYDYDQPTLHGISRGLVGYGIVRRLTPGLIEELHHAVDDTGVVPVAALTLDEVAPAAYREEVWSYEQRTHLGLVHRRPTGHDVGWRDQAGQRQVFETTRIRAYARELCPTSVQLTTAHGTLRTETRLATVTAISDALHCLPSGLTVTGTHADASLDFAENYEVDRAARGAVTRVRRGGPRGLLTVQEVDYDTAGRVIGISAPGRGTETFQHDPATGMPVGVIGADGVITEIASFDGLTDQVLEVRNDRGPGGILRNFHRYDGRERLARSWDDHGGGSDSHPVTRLTYTDVGGVRPGVIEVADLVDAMTGSVRRGAEVVGGHGQTILRAALIPEGWALGHIRERDPSRRETKVTTCGTISAAQPWSALLQGNLCGASGDVITRSTVTGMGELEQEWQQLQTGVERTHTGTLRIQPGALVRGVVDGGGHTTEVATDAGGRVLWRADPRGDVTRYTYDAQGRLVGITLPSQNVHHAARFDSYGRIDRVSRSGVGEVRYVYAKITGLLIGKSHASTTGRIERTVALEYDGIGRVVRETSTLASSGQQQTFDFVHDGETQPPIPGQRGFLTQVIGNDYRKTITRAPTGLVSRTRYELGGWREVEVTARYGSGGDLLGTSRTVRDDTGQVIETVEQTHVTDAYGRLEAIHLNGAPMMTLGYDGRGRLAQTTFPGHGVLDFSYDGVTKELNGYWLDAGVRQSGVGWMLDARGLVEREVTSVDGTNWDRGYSYDERGYLSSVQENNGVEQWTFDADGLPETADDALGARSLVRTGSSLQAGRVTYQYDDLGRVTQKGRLALTYGPLGQISEAVDPGLTAVSYVYDERGERILKRRSKQIVEGYVLGGYLDAQRFVEPVKVGGRLVGTISGGSLILLATDPRGSVIGDVAGPQRLSPFGARSKHPLMAAAFDFVEKGYDADLDVVRIGVRDYDPRLGQFWTPDALLFEQLDACAERPDECNLYGYAGNNPVSLMDRDGFAGDGTAVLKGYLARVVQHQAHDPMVGALAGPAGQVMQKVVQQFVPAPVRALDQDTRAGTLEKLLPTNQAAASWVAADGATGAERGAHLADTMVGFKETVELAMGIRALGQLVSKAPQLIAGRLMARCAGACGVAGSCFVAGTPVYARTGTVAIDTIEVGDRVEARTDCGDTEVDPATWRTVDLEMLPRGEPGSSTWVTTVRPMAWIEDHGAEVGAWIEVAFDELGLGGPALVLAVRAAPTIPSGEGCVVLSTMERRSEDVLTLRTELAREPIGVTSTHRFFSLDRGAWVAAGDLVLGERLESLAGEDRVAEVGQRAEGALVYNIEVESRRTYYVGAAGVLAHNNCGDQLVGMLRDRVRTLAGFGGKGRPYILDENVTNSTLLADLRARGHNVRSVKEIFGVFGTPDSEIIKVADSIGAKVITNNVKDFGRPRTIPLPRPGRWGADAVERLIEMYSKQ